MKQKTFKCSICGAKSEGFGHNPEPIKNVKQRCCGVCNDTIVIPARLNLAMRMMRQRKEEQDAE